MRLNAAVAKVYTHGNKSLCFRLINVVLFGRSHQEIVVHVKHRKWELEGVHGQGCNLNLWRKAAVAKVYTHGNKSRLFNKTTLPE